MKTFRSIILSACVGWMLSVATAAENPKPDAAEALFQKCVKMLNYGDQYSLNKPTKNDAVTTLGLLGDERAVDVLTEHLENEPNDHLRQVIAKALGWIGSKKAIPALQKATQDKYVFVRTTAREAICLIKGEIYDRRNDPDQKPMIEKMQKNLTERVEQMRQERLKREATEKP